MNILFLGSYCPSEGEHYIRSLSTYFDSPGNTLQRALLNGLDSFANVNVISSLKIESKAKKIDGFSFSHNQVSRDFVISTYSSLISRKLFNSAQILKAYDGLNFDPNLIFVYSYSFELLKAVHLIKQKNKKVKVLIMITDLAEFMRSNLGVKKILKSLESKLCLKYIDKYVDGYLFLSEHMKNRFPMVGKKYAVIEGIFQPEEISKDMIVEKNKNFVFLYTGNLDTRYGIVDLLNAFLKLSVRNAELWICGKGDALSIILQKQKEDDRIKYWGQVDRTTVLKLQKSATVLVNPRHSSEEFSKYSFPSKTIEYLASGTPTLMAPLACLPEEYKLYLFLFEDETVDGMSRKMYELCEKSSEELVQLGHRAAEFIFKNKTPILQCKKIIELYDSL